MNTSPTGRRSAGSRLASPDPLVMTARQCPISRLRGPEAGSDLIGAKARLLASARIPAPIQGYVRAPDCHLVLAPCGRRHGLECGKVIAPASPNCPAQGQRLKGSREAGGKERAKPCTPRRGAGTRRIQSVPSRAAQWNARPALKHVCLSLRPVALGQHSRRIRKLRH